MIKSSDGSLYTGITTDLQRRFNEHKSGPKQAKYFRARQPISIEYSEQFSCRSSASQREYQIKQLSKQAKLKLIEASLKTSSRDPLINA